MHKTRESIDAQQKAAMHPIIFSTPMVQAILNGNKTMTRRIIKQQPRNTISSALKHPSVAIAKPGEYVVDNNRTIICRYGIPGDQLWVRETFFSSLPDEILNATTGTPIFYKADLNDLSRLSLQSLMQEHGYKWKPSIHMTFAAARIFLKIIDIRIERLTDITEEDCISEGISMQYLGFKRRFSFPLCSENFVSPKTAFNLLWEYVNGPGSWDANPWVWVIEFKNFEL